MAEFFIIDGPPGQGKSLYTAIIAERLLTRNLKEYEKSGVIREVWSNLKFAEHVEEQYKGFIKYWSDTDTLIKLRDVDILWDEIATELDSRNFANLSIEMKRFLSQYRKRGIDIYANTQDISMVDARARLMITGVSSLIKVMGSGDPSHTKPAIKTIWGIVWIRPLLNFRETDIAKRKYANFPPEGFFIRKRYVEMYDTTQDIPQGALPALKHIVQYCEHKDATDPKHFCSFKRMTHA